MRGWGCMFVHPYITTHRTAGRKHHSVCFAALAIVAGQGSIDIFYMCCPPYSRRFMVTFVTHILQLTPPHVDERVVVKFLYPQHLDGIWTGQTLHRLTYAPVNEYPEPLYWKLAGRQSRALTRVGAFYSSVFLCLEIISTRMEGTTGSKWLFMLRMCFLFKCFLLS